MKMINFLSHSSLRTLLAFASTYDESFFFLPLSFPRRAPTHTISSPVPTASFFATACLNKRCESMARNWKSLNQGWLRLESQKRRQTWIMKRMGVEWDWVTFLRGERSREQFYELFGNFLIKAREEARRVKKQASIEVKLKQLVHKSGGGLVLQRDKEMEVEMASS